MKVSDVMSKQVDYVSSDTSVKDVCRLIFGRRINGVPVCKGKKVIGFITEHDVLTKFLPSLQEYIEDPFHSADFEGMEKKVREIFELTADKIMSKNPSTIGPDEPLLRSQSMMLVNKVGRLPVVDEKGNLVGMIAKGDIFRAVVGDKLPYVTDEEYHDWLARHYDLTVKWEERLGNEVPDLVTLFKKEKVESVIDIGCGTGEHDIALAKNGFKVLGIESSSLMYRAAQKKLSKLSKEIIEQVKFVRGDYVKVLEERQENFQGAIFMGNAFSHLSDPYCKKTLQVVAGSLDPKHAVMVFQIINFDKVFKVSNRFLDLNFAKSRLDPLHEYAFLEFYDPPRKKGGPLTLNMAVFDFNGNQWKFRSTNSTPIIHLNKKTIPTLLKKYGFKRISFYGSKFFGPLFKSTFKTQESDWLNVVAKR